MKTLMCNHCGLPIQIPEEYAYFKSVEHNANWAVAHGASYTLFRAPRARQGVHSQWEKVAATSRMLQRQRHQESLPSLSRPAQSYSEAQIWALRHNSLVIPSISQARVVQMLRMPLDLLVSRCFRPHCQLSHGNFHRFLPLPLHVLGGLR